MEIVGRSYSVVVITPDFESGNPSSNLGGTYDYCRIIFKNLLWFVE